MQTLQLTLDADEAALLEQILTRRLGDLRMEISNTDAYDFRQGLKQDEARIRTILERLRRDIGQGQP